MFCFPTHIARRNSSSSLYDTVLTPEFAVCLWNKETSGNLVNSSLDCITRFKLYYVGPKPETVSIIEFVVVNRRYI